MFLHFSNDAQMNFQINRALMSVLSEPALPSQTDENARTLADQNARTLAEITAAASKITDMASWSATWWAAAEKAAEAAWKLPGKLTCPRPGLERIV